MKNSKGITLIALVITIIVLLILAAVSIAMLTGENGILTQATNSNDKNLKAEAEEAVKIALNTIMANKAAADSGVGTTGAITDATTTNIVSVITSNNPNCSATLKTEGAANAVRVITYKNSATAAKSVDVTVDANGKITNVTDPTT